MEVRAVSFVKIQFADGLSSVKLTGAFEGLTSLIAVRERPAFGPSSDAF